MRKTISALIGAAAAMAVAFSASAQTGPVVGTVGGGVSGTATGQVESFKGIPFAAPPVGALRWKAPQPAAAWSGVRDGSKFAASCYQQARNGRVDNLSEDCLYLNVWRPANAKPGAKLPVMVWIYGGAFVSGSGALPVYDGTHFAENGVVLVTLNYRLGNLGWFAHPELTKESAGQGTGDFGLMDQVAGLIWVRNNIASFGGDPGNVTIFGESAGGMSVNLLMTSPAARGLFAKAITESGLGRSAAKPLAAAEANGVKFAESVGATDLAALRALPVEKAWGPALTNIEGSANPGPIVDGVVVPENVDRAFAQGHEAKVPWIVGSNNFEASLFPQRLKEPEGYLNAMPPERLSVVTKVYDPEGKGDKKALVAGLMTDGVFTEPARYLAAQHETHGAKTYRYYFGYVAEGARKMVPGAGHAGELVYVFGTLGSFPSAFPLTYTDADKTIAGDMTRYWANFARSGDPNGAGLPAWPENKGDRLLVIDPSGPHAASALRKPQLDLVQAGASSR